MNAPGSRHPGARIREPRQPGRAAIGLARLVAPTNAVRAAWLCGALLAPPHACLAFGASARVSVVVTVLPTRAQQLMAARMSLRQPDGKTVVLDAQQQARYVADPSSVGKHVRAGAGDSLVLTVEY